MTRIGNCNAAEVVVNFRPDILHQSAQSNVNREEIPFPNIKKNEKYGEEGKRVFGYRNDLLKSLTRS